MDDVIGKLRIANGARFDSARTEQTRVDSCTNGTREGVLETIQDWASSEDDAQKHIFWLNGLAGIGKSTIATTIAKWAQAKEAPEKRILGGSFFFSRDAKELSDPCLVFPTLASQLSQFDSRYKRALYDVLRADNDVASSKLQMQFDGLIHKPLSTCLRERPILIVLDALDECSSEVDVKEILRILLHADTVRSESGGPKFSYSYYE